MKNTLPVVAAIRQPRSVVRINGVVITGFDSWELENNTFYSADSFHLTLVVQKLASPNDLAWFVSQTVLTVEILVGFPQDPANYTASELQSFIIGNVDSLEYSAETQTIIMSGRDRTAELIDEKTSQKYPNLTASQIAEQIAAEHGLTPVVTPTSTVVGKFYEIDHVRMQDERTEWDLLTWLAREEQYVVFVQGNSLYFQPAPQPSQDPYVFQWTPAPQSGGYSTLNATTLHLKRNLTIAKGIQVTVTSWNSKAKFAYTKKATSAGGAGKNPQKYSYRIAGLSPDQCQQRAQQLLGEISKHQVTLSVDGPADNILMMTDIIQVKGTGTDFDQIYYPDTITREFSVEEGYRWAITAKNTSTESEPNV